MGVNRLPQMIVTYVISGVAAAAGVGAGPLVIKWLVTIFESAIATNHPTSFAFMQIPRIIVIYAVASIIVGGPYAIFVAAAIGTPIHRYLVKRGAVWPIFYIIGAFILGLPFEWLMMTHYSKPSFSGAGDIMFSVACGAIPGGLLFYRLMPRD